MAKALASINSPIFYSSGSNGFSFSVRYGLEGEDASTNSVSVIASNVSQPDSVLKAIKDAVISDASSSFSVTLSLDDVIVV